MRLNSLVKDTAIYGLSSIVGRFLNYLLVPLYTYVLRQTADYGIVTNLYAWTALLLVVLTYGMETGFFRFANREDLDSNAVYRTSLLSLLTTSSVFALVCVFCRQPIASLMGYADHAEFIALMGVTVAMDAFACIPFAYLRQQKRAITFAALKLLFVALNIGFNILFLVVLGWQDVVYVFVSNLLATTIQTAILLPLTWPKKSPSSSFSSSSSYAALLLQMLRYSLPLLVLGVAGIMNQTLDRIIFPYLYTGEDAQAQLGVYGACFKVAMVMMIFTQAFRYAYEPFVFSRHKDRNSAEAQADAMKYYILCSYAILLLVTLGLPVFRYIIAPAYWSGLKIVPIVLWTYVFQGIYFNLSFWYKLTDQTRWGAYFSLIALAINLVLQVVGVPLIGYYASCGAGLVAYFVVMVLSYAIGRYYTSRPDSSVAPVPYDLRAIARYTLVTLVLFTLIELFN